MQGDLFEVWVYLSASPLLGLTVTLVAYLVAARIYQASGRHPLLHPVLVSVSVLIALLRVTDTDYATYFEGAQFVHFLLGPATVALAVPLYRQLPTLRRQWLPILAAVLGGVLVAAASAVAVAAWLGAGEQTLMSLAPKSVTTPVAMGIAREIGGLPSLTAAMVVITGLGGAALGPKLLDLMGVRDDTARGIALGVAAHGIGTARGFEENATVGSFAGLAMVLSALLTALLLPPLVGLVR